VGQAPLSGEDQFVAGGAENLGYGVGESG